MAGEAQCKLSTVISVSIGGGFIEFHFTGGFFCQEDENGGALGHLQTLKFCQLQTLGLDRMMG